MSDAYVGHIYNGYRSIYTLCYKLRSSHKGTTPYEHFRILWYCPELVWSSGRCDKFNALYRLNFFLPGSSFRSVESIAFRTLTRSTIIPAYRFSVRRMTFPTLLLVWAIRDGRGKQLIVLTEEQRVTLGSSVTALAANSPAAEDPFISFERRTRAAESDRTSVLICVTFPGKLRTSNESRPGVVCLNLRRAAGSKSFAAVSSVFHLPEKQQWMLFSS